MSYVSGVRVKVAGFSLDRLPLSAEGRDRPLGAIDGLVIDLSHRRVQYFVVASSDTGRKHLLPLGATSIDRVRGTLARMNEDALENCEPFDASAFAQYDDEAMIALMFGDTAA